ncbi:hypothetical protein GGS23DRAFT_577127 [Durotheca rogersii]|uniref:uncharacterized protein n=1 Tax=Durotheca rogersii TaxID=419775 RepID=UPI00221E48DF|nr:uncharacterized protein GGS23DRAFT_577127 [Durotheca rogersii]KAI5861125.1 hypothetical protein GGS23DRAFT_577127 [Durotheca rogersii]
MIPQDEAQRIAATAMSSILSEHQIAHAFIGGFAVATLGHSRATIDIDVEIDVANISELRGRVRQLLTESDARFSVQHAKLFFTPAPTDHPDSRVTIETLPIGELGLPRRLAVIWPNDGTIPVLHPGLLILTKIKRCAQLIGSTRPRSVAKFHSDLSDITFLLGWLAEHDEKVDFAGYASLTPERLYTTTKDLVRHWKDTGNGETVHLIVSVLEDDDRRKIMD